jgi:hypothetical protein
LPYLATKISLSGISFGRAHVTGVGTAEEGIKEDGAATADGREMGLIRKNAPIVSFMVPFASLGVLVVVA